MNWEQIRNDFPVTNNAVYFQSAGMSPIPNQVLDKIIKAYTKLNQFCTGFRQDIETLGKELKKRNILFIVNATLSFPLFPPTHSRKRLACGKEKLIHLQT